MYDFFNKDDLIIIVDDEIIPNNKENFKLIDLQDNMVTLIAKKILRTFLKNKTLV